MIMGFDFGQGVLVAPPMPQQRFLDLLRQRVSKPRALGDAASPSPKPAGAMDYVA
jgi:hypothetical protein